MDETAIAFELPHARASATHAGPPLDRISVRDYTRQVEIGAFRTERGVTQRIRFNVVLEVSHHAAARDDDVDKVISYDSITEAIEAELAAERVNLLETLAERVATRILADPRAVRAFVRIEKLDRIPGALGVEIVRARVPETAPRLHRGAAPTPGATTGTMVVFLAEPSRAWRDALAAWGRPFVLAVAPAAPQPRARSEAAARVGLLAIEQAAWTLAADDPRFGVAGTRTELDWAIKSGHLTVWAPVHMATASLHGPVPDASDPGALAAWLAAELGAEGLLIAGGSDVPPPSPTVETAAVAAAPAVVVVVARPEDLATQG